MLITISPEEDQRFWKGVVSVRRKTYEVPWLALHDVRAYENGLFLLRTAERPITLLRAGADIKRVLDDLEFKAVKEARSLGHSWAEIAESLRRSRQSVWRQYANKVGEDGGDQPRPLV